MTNIAPKPLGYRPGSLGNATVVALLDLYLVGIYLDGMHGADLSQGAILYFLLPFIFVAPAWLVGAVLYFIAGRRRRVGDIGFTMALTVECVAALFATRFV